MIIILEGCDCSGKSTFANELSRITGYEIVKGSSFEISELGTKGMFEHMSDLLDRDNIIIDRFYMSNFVYGNLYNYPTMSESQFENLANKADGNAITLYLTASETTIKNRMDNRGDDMIKVNEVKGILEKYEEAIRSPLTATRFMLTLDTTYNYSSTELTALMVSAFASNLETAMFVKDKQ